MSTDAVAAQYDRSLITTSAASRFLNSLAAMELLSGAAERGQPVVAVDDAQGLDRGRAGDSRAENATKQAAGDAVTGRFTRPEEVADLVVLLAGERAGNVTGADSVIEGGYSPPSRRRTAFRGAPKAHSSLAPLRT